MAAEANIRVYRRSECAVFSKTKEAFGGLSNMAAGFPLRVNGIHMLTSEALYQACRFPHRPEIQKMIIGEHSPMTAKMKSKPYRSDSRPDWDQVRVKIMRWCLRVKLAQNWKSFSELLLSTSDKPIVEESYKDDFWGARPNDDGALIGTNALGRLLMELREAVKTEGRDTLVTVEPLPILDFLLDGRPIQVVIGESRDAYAVSAPSQRPTVAAAGSQSSLFDQPTVRESMQKYEAKTNNTLAIDSLKPYPAMKESGVPWLGMVPEHWDVLPNRALFTEVKQRDCPDEQMLSVTITKGVIKQRALLEDSSKKDSSNLDKSKYKLVCPGDIAYNKMRAWQGAIGASSLRGIISPAYVVQRPHEGVSPEYFHYLLRTPAFAKEAERWSYGITSDMWSLRPEHFKMIYSCLPPADEQASIVRFLDHAERRIRRYIRAKQKLIKLLEEQKQAIIHRAVTRGIDPNVRLKPSGVEWLGDVPEHWEVLPLRRVTVSRCDGPFGSGLKSSHYTSVGVRVVRLQNIGHGEFKNSDAAYIAPEYYATLGDHSVLEGDLLIAGLGDDRRPAGRACVAPSTILPAMVKADCFRFRLNRQRVAPIFVALHLSATSDGASAALSTGSTRQRTNLQTTASRQISFPSPSEQCRIVEHISVATRQIDYALERASTELDLLHKYRTRLIADVVTGKLDASVVAANLPDTTDDEAPDVDGVEAETEDEGTEGEGVLEETEA